MAVIAIVGALDTKGIEVGFLRTEVERRGHRALVVDIGVLGAPAFEPAVSRHEVAAETGEFTLEALIERGDRGHAVTVMARGAAALVERLHRAGRVDAILGLGGGAGTSVATSAMRALPLGVPKLMISTLAGGDVRGFVDVSDIVMVPAVVDVSGLNRISREVFTRAVAALCAMVEVVLPSSADVPVIVASMFGNTTECVEAARATFERAGYEVLVFHATGTGGRTMEGLIESGYVAGVFDATTTEWADELVGGVLTAGPKRLEAAATKGIPAVVAPGCLDMVNFWAPETIPERFAGRRFYAHNPNVTLMRTTPEENVELGRVMADKLNKSVGPVAVYLPLAGLSVISAPGGPFHWPEADTALFDSLRERLRPDIPVHALDLAINDRAFADAMSGGLIAMLEPADARRLAPGAPRDAN